MLVLTLPLLTFLSMAVGAPQKKDVPKDLTEWKSQKGPVSVEDHHPDAVEHQLRDTQYV